MLFLNALYNGGINFLDWHVLVGIVFYVLISVLLMFSVQKINDEYIGGVMFIVHSLQCTTALIIITYLHPLMLNTGNEVFPIENIISKLHIYLIAGFVLALGMLLVAYIPIIGSLPGGLFFIQGFIFFKFILLSNSIFPSIFVTLLFVILSIGIALILLFPLSLLCSNKNKAYAFITPGIDISGGLISLFMFGYYIKVINSAL